MNSKLFFFSLICLGLLTVGCERSTDENFAEKIAISIDSVAIPSETITLGTSVRIETYQDLLKDCELFYGFTLEGTSFEKEISAYGFKTEAPCGLSQESQQLLAFTPEEVGTYHLKFRTSETLWIEKTLVVTPAGPPVQPAE